MAKLNIFLGHKCNFSCSYCLQSFNKDDYLHIDNINIDLLVDKLSQEVKDRTINKISYWGGEPLMYFDKIIELHNKFAERGVFFNFVKFLTNGSLLTEDKVEALNAMNAYVGISIHTGFGEPRWDLLSKLNKWSIIFLHTGKNNTKDILEQTRELELKHNIQNITPYMHWVRATENCGEEDYFTEETLKEHKTYLYDLAIKRLEGDVKAYKLFQPHIDKMLAKFKQTNFNGSLCVNNRILTVDMYGNKFSCHHSPVKENYLGNIFNGEVDLPNTDINKAKEIQFQYVNSNECTSCNLRSWCRGNCYLSKTHEMDCKLQKIKFEVFDFILRNEREKL